MQLKEESYIPKTQAYLFPVWLKLSHFSLDET